jgi:NhaP-type Na+/H+ or K+/H+ antiporter
MYEQLAIVAAFVFAFSLIAGRVDRLPLSGPMIYVAFGLVMGPAVLGTFTLSFDTEALRTLAELTLAFVLFTGAANADLGVLNKTYKLPARLLLVGLPLTILAGFGVGVVLFRELSFFELVILATMLAPTDAALGKAVVENKAVPPHIREGLNVESGLNDGICVPILFVFLALATHANTEGSTLDLAVRLIVEEIGIGLVVGLGLTLLGGWLLKLCGGRGWISGVWVEIPVGALSVTCFAVSQILGGSGFIAAFSGGLLFGALFREPKDRLLKAAVGTGEKLALLTWVVFGSAVVGRALGSFSLPVLGYAILSLTLVRMVPVALSVIGLRLHASSTLFLGWFGPRGLASIVFGIIVADANLTGGGTVTAVVVATITMSVVLHGITAYPLSIAYGRIMRRSNP